MTPKQQRIAARREKVRMMQENGATIAEICLVTRCSHQTVYRDLEALGLAPNDDVSARARMTRKSLKTGRRCVQCGEREDLDRVAGMVLCRDCIIRNYGSFDPDYEERQREAVLQGFGDSPLASAPSMAGFKGPINLHKRIMGSMKKNGVPTGARTLPGVPRQKAPEEIIPFGEDWTS